MKVFRNRIIALLLAAAVWTCALPAAAEGEPELASEAAVLMDAETGQVLFEKNMHEKLYPASITKIMTALLALQELDPRSVLTVSRTAVDAVPRTSSHISLTAGERMTVDDALYAIGMESANDAANVLAEAVSGSLEDFAARMTETAASLGAVNTRFTNANGLPDENHYTTAYDMALITAAALREPGFTTYFSTVEHTMNATNLSDARTFHNKDRLLPGGQYYYEGVLMAKTGWTSSAQGTFAAAVRYGDTILIAVTLKSPLLEDKYRDTTALMNYGFTRYARQTLSGEALGEKLPLDGYTPLPGQSFSFQLETAQDWSTLEFETGEWIPDGTGEAAVPVTVKLGEEALSDMTLHVKQAGTGDAAEISPKVESAVEIAVENVRSYGIPVVLSITGLLLAAMIFRRVRHEIIRRRRHRQTSRRILRMKRQMRR